jgi:type I restriction enzyme S subunit
MTPTCQLGDIASVVMGQAPPGSDCNKDGRGEPFVKAGEFSADKPIVREWTTNPLKRAQNGDVLVCVVGATAGKVNLAIDCAIGRSVAAVRPLPQRLDTNYLHHFLRTKTMALRHGSQGLAQGVITREMLLSLNIPLPPLEEQRRIAAILDKGESIKALFAKREKAFLSVEESLFTALHEDDNRGLTGKAYSLSDVFWFQEGPGVRNWQFTTSGIKLLNVGNITIDGRVDLRRSERHVSEDEAFGRYSHFLVDEGDLLMPSSGIPIEGDGLLRTRSAFATSSDLPLCMNTSTIRFKPKMEEASLLFLQGWLQSREFRVQITKLVTGSAQKNFGPSHLKQLSITLPHPSLQDDFEKKLTRVRELRHSLHPSESNLIELMFSLGNLAFNGGASA